jgi:DNA helicase II / ATP-dependent DNA helicase PcrA
VVFVTGMEEGVFPHQRSIDEQNLEEERRLAYVGVTRAMDCLFLVHARARSLWGGSMYNLPSRFLGEIPAVLAEKKVVGRRGGAAAGWGGAGGSGYGGSGGGWQGERAGGGYGRGGRRDDDRDWSDGGFDSIGGSGRRITGLEKDDSLDEQVVSQYFSPGERVLHAILGEGTVVAVEANGIVLVRFQNDGSERRLMASVAPLRKLRA